MSAIGCSSAERADAVRAVAVLEAAEQLALGEQHDRHELQADGEDHERLEDLDPPRLVVADVGERDERSCLAHLHERARRARSRSPRRSPSSRKTRARAAPRRAARRSPRTRVPFEPTTTRSPSRTPRRWASAGESSTRWRGCRNCSAGETSTSGAAQSERNVPRRRRAVGAGAARRRRLELERPELDLGGEGARRVALLPAHAAAADLVERQAGVERHGLGELRGGHRRRSSTPRSRPTRARRARRAPATRRAPRPGGRSPGAGAARARRGA